MVSYIVFLCPDCSFPRYAKEGQKTAECFMCGNKIQLNDKRTRILLKTKKVDEAVTAVKKFKENQRNRGKL